MDIIKKWCKKCEKYEVISFDIFDTLLRRDVQNPEDIFKIVECYASNKFGDRIKDFSSKRVLAGKIAFEKTMNGEATLNDIYKEIEGFTENELNELSDLEMKIEYKFLRKNSMIYPLYNWCKSNNKKLIAISDMYLSSEFLKKVLEKNNIICDEVFVSCEEKANKRMGTIFECVQKKLNISSNRIIHIGDSLKSDFLKPREYGWNSIHIKKSVVDYGISLTGKIINSHLSNYKSENYFYDMGYKVLGPILYGFSEWLYEKTNEKHISSLLFFSRDGKIMKEAFQILYGEKIKLGYIHVSRKSLNTVTLWKHPDFNQLKRYIIITNNFSINTFLNRMGLEPKNYKELLKKYELDGEHQYSQKEFWDNPIINNFYNNIQCDIVATSKVQYEFFIQYLKQFSITPNMGIVDIGWRGSMQKRFYEVLQSIPKYEHINLNGFYMGIESDSNNVNGYLYQTSDQTRTKTVIDAGFGLFETLFLAHEGTTISYTCKNNLIEPILDEYEMRDIYVIKQLDTIHKAALDFIRKMKELRIHSLGIVYPQEIFHYFEELVYNPSRKDLEEISKLVFNDTENIPLILVRSWMFYIKNIYQLKIDYHKAPWKIGFLKKNFGMRIAWGKIYKVLKNR